MYCVKLPVWIWIWIWIWIETLKQEKRITTHKPATPLLAVAGYCLPPSAYLLFSQEDSILTKPNPNPLSLVTKQLQLSPAAEIDLVLGHCNLQQQQQRA